MYYCTGCNEQFNELSELEQHTKKEHGDNYVPLDGNKIHYVETAYSKTADYMVICFNKHDALSTLETEEKMCNLPIRVRKDNGKILAIMLPDISKFFELHTIEEVLGR